MAATDITITQFQTELGTVKSAIRSRDWDTAYQELGCAEITLAGLASQISDQGTMLKYRQQLDGARAALDTAKAGLSQSTSQNRIALGRMSYGRRNGSDD